MNTFEHNTRKPSDSDDKEPTDDKRARVLVVDDDLGVRRLFVYVLKKAGYDADAVEDGQAALEALSKRSYDLLVTDNNMPRVSGLDLIRKLRSSRVTLPIIMASGTFQAEAIESNDPTKFAAILSKPVSISTLLDQVNRILHGSEVTRKMRSRKSS